MLLVCRTNGQQLCRAQLGQSFTELQGGIVEVWIRSISQSIDSKSYTREQRGGQLLPQKLLPECLSISRNISLTCCGDGYDQDIKVVKIILFASQLSSIWVAYIVSYQTRRIQRIHHARKTKPPQQSPQLLCCILSIASLRAIENEGFAGAAMQGRHGLFDIYMQVATGLNKR
jgi:hypothetical protein